MFILTPRSGSCALAGAAAACLAALLSACGGGMGSASSAMGMGTTTPSAASTSSSMCMSSPCEPMMCMSMMECAPTMMAGAAMMTMTDAKGDFLSYVVSLTSVQLQSASGAMIETLPVATKIDFAQLVDLTEVLSAGQIPAANYASAQVTLDYTNAAITADDGSGNAVALKPVDMNGNVITGAVTLTVQLDNVNRLIITPGNTARLAFDFNLAASNTVNLASGTVQVTPTLVASVVPSDTKPVRVRGTLGSVTQSGFMLSVEPFYTQEPTGGQVTVQVGPATTYQINGTAYVGPAGITALGALPPGTMTAALGTLQTGTQMLIATSVIAGTSLENPALDQVVGAVIARSQMTLTLRGATLYRHTGDFDFELGDVSVALGPNTAVTQSGSMGSFTVANVSVGQHIQAFGTATQPPGGALSLDATAGSVQLEPTPAWGLVTSMTPGSLTLNLQSLDGLSPAMFNFAGTGSSSAGDATASAYVVNTGTLSQAGVAVSAPVGVIGIVTPFGAAPPNFTAQTLATFASATDELAVGWGTTGSVAAFTGLTAMSTSLQLNLTGVGLLHYVRIGPERLDLTTLATAPQIAPDTTTANEVFSIGHAGVRTENFNTFAAFVTALAGELNGMTAVIATSASGQYDSNTNVITATRVAVLLSD
jgi:hypothetical protein